MDCGSPGSSVRGISQAIILEMHCHFLLQGIFAAQGSNSHLLLGQADSVPLSQYRSPLNGSGFQILLLMTSLVSFLSFFSFFFFGVCVVGGWGLGVHSLK